MEIVRFIAAFWSAGLVAPGVQWVGAVSWEEGVDRAGRFVERTIHTTILRTARWPTILVACFVRRVRAITVPGRTNVTHGLQSWTLC